MPKIHEWETNYILEEQMCRELQGCEEQGYEIFNVHYAHRNPGEHQWIKVLIRKEKDGSV